MPGRAVAVPSRGARPAAPPAAGGRLTAGRGSIRAGPGRPPASAVAAVVRAVEKLIS